MSLSNSKDLKSKLNENTHTKKQIETMKPCNFQISSAKIDERLLSRKILISFVTNRIQAAKRHSHQSSMRRANYPIVQIFSKDTDFLEEDIQKTKKLATRKTRTPEGDEVKDVVVRMQ